MTVEIQLTKGYVAVIDDEDADLAKNEWYAKCRNGFDYLVYAARNVPNGVRRQKTIRIHQIILARILNRPLEKGELADHIDRNGLNNRRENIRLANHSQNLANTSVRRNSKSGVKGVHWDKVQKKWAVSIGVRGEKIWVGRFDDLQQAGDAYEKAAIKYFGEYSRKI